MRISDWSSDVCSSDLVIGEILKAGMPPRRAHHAPTRAYRRRTVRGGRHRDRWRAPTDNSGRRSCRHKPAAGGEIGSASCRERVVPDVSITVVHPPFTTHNNTTTNTSDTPTKPK